jgi:hypothetical protein
MTGFSSPKAIFLASLLTVFSSISIGSTLDSTPAVDSRSIDQPEQSNQKIEALWVLIDDIYQRMQRHMRSRTDVDTIADVLNKSCAVGWDNDARVQALLSEANNADSDKGLKLRAGYTTGDLDSGSNGDDGNSYVELSWDVLRGGYKDYQHQADRLRTQAKIEAAEGELQRLKLDYRCRSYNIIQRFSGLESALLSLKLEFMEPVYEVEKKAYFSGWSFLDDYLVSERDVRDARQRLEYFYSNPGWQAGMLSKINPPAIDVDLMSVMEAIRQDTRYADFKALEQGHIVDNNRYQKGSQFRLFLRQQFSNSPFNDDDIVAGLRFSMPIVPNNQSLDDYKLKQYEKDAALYTWEKIARTQRDYDLLHEQLNRVVKLQYRYISSHERVRRTRAHRSLGQELELAAVIARMRTFLETSIELIQAKKKLYQRVNAVFLSAELEFDQRFIKVNQLQQVDYRARTGNRSVYIWSTRFNQMPNNQILAFLTTKNIHRVLMSAGKKTDKDKLADFLAAAREQGVIVESIIGSNRWLFPANHSRARAAIDVAMERYRNIHLDIEPHALDGTAQEKLVYLDQYIDLLSSLRKKSAEHYLSIAVPFHWPDESYQKLALLSDKLYVMTYGSTKVSTILRRLKRIIDIIPKEKVAVVLRVTDFKNEWEMEQVIETIHEEIGVEDFSFHKLDTFIEQKGY